jgi:hypothetical protein
MQVLRHIIGQLFQVKIRGQFSSHQAACSSEADRRHSDLAFFIVVNSRGEKALLPKRVPPGTSVLIQYDSSEKLLLTHPRGQVEKSKKGLACRGPLMFI